MCFIYKNSNSKRIYLINIIFILILNILFINKLYANSFQISDIKIKEKFDLNFNKEKVFEKGFIAAFDQLTSMVTIQEDKKRLKNTKITTIKSLIDSFNIGDEKFINEEYIAKFNVNFNKKKTLIFFEKENIFPSIPKKINVLMIPVLININEEKLLLFNENPIYKDWSTSSKNFYLINYILPNEDIEDRKFLQENLETLEKYNFNQIIDKYEMSNYVINIIYQENNTLKVFSKVKFNDDLKIINQTFKEINLNEEKSLRKVVNKLKTTYEDNWKKLNIINTSIKLPITVALTSSQNKKIKLFENTIKNLDLVSSFNIILFNNKDILYKIIYNGPPNKFLSEIEKNQFVIEKGNQTWRIR